MGDKITHRHENKEYSVPFIFQIWERKNYKRNIILKEIKNEHFSFVKKEEADIAIRRVGNLSGKVIFDINKYAESSHYYLKINKNKRKIIKILEYLFDKLNKVSRNTAGNPSLSKRELVEILKENIKKP